MKIEFREAGSEDIDLLIELYNSAFRDDYLRYGQCPAYGRTRESMEQSLRDYPKTIAYDRDKAVGLISCGAEGPGKYYIGCLGVRKEEQGRGIGTLLMNHFLEEHPDWNEITLVTPKDNERNIRFYTRRFGFEITGEEDDGKVTVLWFRLNRPAPVPGEKATRKELARVAKAAAQTPFHGFTDGEASNLEPIVRPFPGWKTEEADRLWCAAFVYYCCREAGFDFPIRPDECRICHLAGCIAWEEFAKGDPRIEYHPGRGDFVPEAGDIVLYDRVFENREHDHIGIVIENRGNAILAAEGNIGNRSGLIERPLDDHIRAFIRIPDGFRYRTE